MRTMKFTALLSLILTISAYGQTPVTDSQAKEEVSKLSFIVGNWEGEGWMMGRDGTKHPFKQTEKIQFKLDSTAVLIEGLGTNQGQVIHNALAIVTFNKEEENYTFNSFLSSGRGGSFEAKLVDDKFHWYPNENMRYIISLNEKGQWYERGEMNREGNWFQFFEMTLDKK
jgi:hypothetical protein